MVWVTAGPDVEDCVVGTGVPLDVVVVPAVGVAEVPPPPLVKNTNAITMTIITPPIAAYATHGLSHVSFLFRVVFRLLLLYTNCRQISKIVCRDFSSDYGKTSTIALKRLMFPDR